MSNDCEAAKIQADGLITLELLTKATGKMKQIDPDTGDFVFGESGIIEIAKRVLSPTKASKCISRYMSLKISTEDPKDKPKLWRSDGKIWIPDGEIEVKNQIDATIGDLSYEKGLQETIRRLRGVSETVTFDSNPYLFPALDKIIDLQTGIARDYRQDDYFTFKYGAAVDYPNADYRLFLWFLCSSLPDPRDVLMALDIVTAIAIRIPFDIIVLLFGGGSNGKGIFEKVILALFTMARATAVILEEMKRSQFGPGAVLNKDVWIVTEVESVKDAMSVLKKISTGELLDSDVKYGERVQGMPHVITILDSNNPFDFGDNSHGRQRRTTKIDFPYTFGDASSMRPIDRHLEEKLTRPEVLTGILKIVAARAPALIKSRRIYRRKSTGEQEDELRRQQFHLATFCNDCVITGKDLEGVTPNKLKVDDIYGAYKEYCKLFNVTAPAEKVPFGRYISERYKIQSVSTSETVDNKKINYRYYPDIYLNKSPKSVYDEVKTSFNDIYYGYYTSTTDLLQIWNIENSNSSDNTTDTTDKMLSGVISEIVEMYTFISSCKDERDISYDNYVKKSVVSVVSVVNDPRITVFSTTDGKLPVVELESSVVKTESIRDQVIMPEGRGEEEAASSSACEDEPTSTTTKKESEDPGFEKFKQGMKKRHCLMCERHFSYDLGIHYLNGYICQACQSGQGPVLEKSAKHNPQKTLADSEAPA